MKSFGLMFHHFHDNSNFKRSEGSISKKQFKRIILDFKKNILTPQEFKDVISSNNPKIGKAVCITFDDSIKSQIGVALEILDDLKLKAFFFSNTFQFEKKIGLIETCRYFRNNYFSNINYFYELFFQTLLKKFSKNKLEKFFKNNKKFFIKWKKSSPFYSKKDLEFRLVRDFFLKKDEYNSILIELFVSKKFDYKTKSKQLHFDKKDIYLLSNNNHEIGLHSHNHPVPITSLSFNQIKSEYKKNLYYLNKITKRSIESMAHPNGYFDKKCSKALREIKIKFGFSHSYKHLTGKNLDILNIPRIDHSELI